MMIIKLLLSLMLLIGEISSMKMTKLNLNRVKSSPHLTRSDERADTKKRTVVAIGDLHGDLAAAVILMKRAMLINAELDWIGGDVILVQTGDVVDKGPESAQVLDLLLLRLKPQAIAEGGNVVVLLGNHELLAMFGELKNVHPGDLAYFGGVDGRIQAFQKEGFYGNLLRQLDSIYVHDRVVFAHAGVLPKFAAYQRVNEIIKGLLQLDNLNEFMEDDALIGRKPRTGPAWLDLYNLAPPFLDEAERTICATLSKALRKMDADKMVVGHSTTHNGRVQTRCHDQLFIIDTGISAYSDAKKSNGFVESTRRISYLEVFNGEDGLSFIANNEGALVEYE